MNSPLDAYLDALVIYSKKIERYPDKIHKFQASDLDVSGTKKVKRVFKNLICKRLLSFSYPYIVKKVLHRGQIFEIMILIDLHVLRASESKNHIFNGLCVSVINITQNQFVAETPNLVLNIYIICRCNLKFFMKIGKTICAQGYTK